MKRRTVIVLTAVINGEATEKQRREIDRITEDLITYFNPDPFTGSDSTEIKYDRKFENMCLLLSQNLNVNAKEYTVLEYYNAFEFLKDLAKKHKTDKTPNKAI